jgi:hypothetical protein
METTYVIITVVVTCTVLGGGYLLYRRSPRGWFKHDKNSNILTLREITHMATLEEEAANREELFLTHGQVILTQMQELDQAYKRWEHAREH